MTRLVIMLRLYIAAGNFTQNEISSKIGINKSSLSRFLNGKSLTDESFIKVLKFILEREIL